MNLRSGAAGLLLIVFAAACTRNDVVDLSPSRQVGPITGAESAQPDTSARPPRDAPAAGACSEEVAGLVEAAIGTQLAAFADEDFPAAYAVATEGFRMTLTLSQFQAVIQSVFPIVATNTGFSVEACLDGGDETVSAPVVVESGDQRQSLLYSLERDDAGDWRIGGAVPAGETI